LWIKFIKPLQKSTQFRCSIISLANIQTRYKANISAIKTLKEQIEKLYDYYKYGTTICEKRINEGIFINQSLEEVRKTIQEILIYNAEDSIETTPDFIEDCLKLYCPTGKDCFQMNHTVTNEPTIQSELFNSIYEHYLVAKPETEEDSVKLANKKKFYDELIVNIFCVLNITKSANDPPVVPYIDINSLKRMFNNRLYLKQENKTPPPGKYSENNKAKFILEIKKVFYNIAKYPKKLKELHESEDIQKLAKLFLPEISFPYTPTSDDLSGSDVFHSDLTVEQTIKYMSYILESTNDAKPTNETDTIKKLSINLENSIYNAIFLIDKTNAASVIGTLEFVDIMSKFGTTDNICTVEDLEVSSNESKFPYMKKLLQLHEISNHEFLQQEYKTESTAEPETVDFFKLLSDYYKYEENLNTWEKKPVGKLQSAGKRNKTTKRQIGCRKNRTERIDKL
jgi:hypothetical protein